MKFHEVDMRGHIWVERTSTGKPSFVSGDTGRLMFVTAGTSANKLFYADNTKWVEIGDQTMLLNHIADVSNTVHGIGDKFSEHKYGSYYNHNLSNTTSAGFLRTLDGEPTHFMDGTGNWAEVDTTASKTVITQAGHGLTFGTIVMHNGTKFVAAKADSIANAEVVGMVSNVIDSGHFELTTHGYVSGNNFKFVTYTGGIPPYTIRTGPVVAGSVYFLNDAAAGYMSTTEPSITGHVSKPLFIATSTTTGYFFNWRGVVIESGAISTVNSVTAGTGITVSPTTGDVVVSNDGVLSIRAGANIILEGTAQNPIINASTGKVVNMGSVSTSSKILSLTGPSYIGEVSEQYTYNAPTMATSTALVSIGLTCGNAGNRILIVFRGNIGYDESGCDGAFISLHSASGVLLATAIMQHSLQATLVCDYVFTVPSTGYSTTFYGRFGRLGGDANDYCYANRGLSYDDGAGITGNFTTSSITFWEYQL